MVPQSPATPGGEEEPIWTAAHATEGSDYAQILSQSLLCERLLHLLLWGHWPPVTTTKLKGRAARCTTEPDRETRHVQ